MYREGNNQPFHSVFCLAIRAISNDLWRPLRNSFSLDVDVMYFAPCYDKGSESKTDGNLVDGSLSHQNQNVE